MNTVWVIFLVLHGQVQNSNFLQIGNPFTTEESCNRAVAKLYETKVIDPRYGEAVYCDKR